MQQGPQNQLWTGLKNWLPVVQVQTLSLLFQVLPGTVAYCSYDMFLSVN